MKQPIWIRERKPPTPPPTFLRPALRTRRRGGKPDGAAHRLVGRLPRPLSQVRREGDPALIEVILMRYRLLILVFSVWMFKR